MSGIGVAEMVDYAGPGDRVRHGVQPSTRRAPRREGDRLRAQAVLGRIASATLSSGPKTAHPRAPVGELAHELSSLSADRTDRPAAMIGAAAAARTRRPTAALAFNGRRSIGGAEDQRDPLDRGRRTTAAATGARAATWSGCRWRRSMASSIRPCSCALPGRDRQPGRGGGTDDAGRQLPAPGRRHTRAGESRPTEAGGNRPSAPAADDSQRIRTHLPWRTCSPVGATCRHTAPIELSRGHIPARRGDSTAIRQRIAACRSAGGLLLSKRGVARRPPRRGCAMRGDQLVSRNDPRGH